MRSGDEAAALPTDKDVELISLFRRVLPLVEESRARPMEPLNRAGAFEGVDLDLADAAYSARGGGDLKMGGFGLVYLKRGSHPGGMYKLRIGGELQSFGPGDVYKGPFTDLKLERHASSATVGYARFLVLKHPLADYRECVEQESAFPVPLVGTFDEAGNVTAYGGTIAEDTDPSGAAGNAAFSVAGWEEIELFFDVNSNGGNATSFDLIPWVAPGVNGASTVWHEQGTERISVPDSDTSGKQYRTINMRVGVRGGLLDFSLRNLLAAARTQVKFAARGVR